jgi:hypothetical protein
MLFAYDMRDKHIKGYVMTNVRKAALTDRRFTPKWPVELAMWLLSFGLGVIIL